MADIDESKIPKEIKNKYTVVDNTFLKPVQTKIERKIDLEIGDAKQSDFKPQFKTKWFDNEYNFSFRTEEDVDATIEQDGEKIKYIGKDKEVHIYDKPEVGEEGGVELEWYLPKKPKTNILKATLQFKGDVKFYYQPELTEKEIEEGVERPDNVVGSYAVYIDKSNHCVGGNNYATGKIAHIYRPKAIDAKGNETWCELSIPESSDSEKPVEVQVTVPQEFLDKAVYPVVVDPTFGYTTAGVTVVYNFSNFVIISGDTFSPASSGSVSSISGYIKNSGGGNSNWQGAIYDGNSLVTNGGSSSISILSSETTPSWKEASFASNPSVLSTSSYYLAQNAQNTYINTYLDLVGTNKYKYDPQTFNSWDSTASWVTDSSSIRKFSIYATYTQGGGSGATAEVNVLALELTPHSVTATHVLATTATVSSLALALTVHSVTATYTLPETAEVNSVSLTLTPQPVTATYTYPSTAEVNALSLSLTPHSVTALSGQVSTAEVNALALELTTHSVTAEGVSGSTAEVNALALEITTYSPTATYTYNSTAEVNTVALALTPRSITAIAGGSFRKNNQLSYKQGNVIVPIGVQKFPVWSTSTRPTGVIGMFGLNVTTNNFEIYNGTAWRIYLTTTSLTYSPIITVSIDTLLTVDNLYVNVDATSGDIDITLPSATDESGRIYNIKKIDGANDVIVIPAGAETIDGETSQTLTTIYDSMQIVSDGSNWGII